MFHRFGLPIALASTIAFTSPAWAAPPDHHASGHAPAIPATRALEAVLMSHFPEEDIYYPAALMVGDRLRGESGHAHD